MSYDLFFVDELLIYSLCVIQANSNKMSCKHLQEIVTLKSALPSTAVSKCNFSLFGKSSQGYCRVIASMLMRLT